MAKRTQQKVSDESQHWYQDRYQHVLTQRNLLALVSLGALATAVVAVLAVLRLSPLKSVEPYLLEIDEKTGIAQKVTPVSRKEYAANEAVDRYFTSAYLRARESYNPALLYNNYNTVRLMSSLDIFRVYRRQVDASVKDSMAERLGPNGRREVKIRSMAYISAAPVKRGELPSRSKIMQVRITTSEGAGGQPDNEQQWIATITFEYADLAINDAEQLINPLGYQVTNYQIQREIN